MLPSAQATSAPPTAAPTPDPATAAQTLSLPAPLPEVAVVKCHTLDASGGSIGKPPATVHAHVPAALAKKVAAYIVTDGYYVIGPAAAKCSAEIFGNGGATIEIRRRADREAVISITSSVSYFDVLDLTCGFDKRAAKLLADDMGYPCAAIPKSQKVTRKGKGSVTFTVPRRGRGGLPHEVSKYSTLGSVEYDLADELFVDVRACALPKTDAGLCKAILAGSIPWPDIEGWTMSDIVRVEGGGGAAIAVDETGTDHIAFASGDGVSYATNTASGWTVLRTWAGFSGPRIALGPGAAVHIAMTSTADGGTYYVTGTERSFSDPQMVLAGGVSTDAGPVLSLDGLGNVFAARVSHVAVAAGASGKPHLVTEVAIRGTDGRWSPTLVMHADGNAVAVAGLPGGGAQIVYGRAERRRVAELHPDATTGAEHALPKGFGAAAFAAAAGADGRVTIVGIAKAKVTALQGRGGKWVASTVTEEWTTIKPSAVDLAFASSSGKLYALWDNTDGYHSFQLASGPGGSKAGKWKPSVTLTPDGKPASAQVGFAVTARGTRTSCCRCDRPMDPSCWCLRRGSPEG